MQSFVPFALAAPIAATLAGCAIVSSERLVPGVRGAEGVAYALPMARVPVLLSGNAGQVVLQLDAPLLVADPDHHYSARRGSNPFSADQVSIEVDPNTTFLSAVSAVGKDETLAVLEQLLVPKAAPVAESAQAEGEEIYRTEINPADPDELARESIALTNALQAFLVKQASACASPTSVCTEYKRLLARQPQIALSGRRAGMAAAPPPSAQAPVQAASQPAASAAAPPSAASATPVDCSAGVCYRQPLPFVLRATLDGTVRSVYVNIPNASPVIAVPLERHAFVTTTHTLAFEQGTLKSATVDRPSSALALASSPLAAISGLIASVTKPLSELLKIDTSGQYQAKADEAKGKADEAKAKVAAAPASAAPPPATPPKPLAVLTLGDSQAGTGFVVGGAAAPVATGTTVTTGATPMSSGSSGSAPAK